MVDENKLTRNVSFETLFYESTFTLGTDFKINLNLYKRSIQGCLF